MKVAVTITGFIDIPDSWEDPTMKDNPYFPLEVADYRYNEQLDEDDAIDDLGRLLKAYPDDFGAKFDFPDTQLRRIE